MRRTEASTTGAPARHEPALPSSCAINGDDGHRFADCRRFDAVGETFVDADVTIAGGLIASLSGGGTGPMLDASGLLVLPGIVDIHGDGFERLITPRSSVSFEPMIGLLEAERQFLANGITTAFHAVTWSWEGGQRGHGPALAILDALEQLGTMLTVDTRYHLRHETFNLTAEATILQWLAEGRIHALAFNDHMAGTIKQRHRPTRCGRCSIVPVSRSRNFWLLSRAFTPAPTRFLPRSNAWHPLHWRQRCRCCRMMTCRRRSAAGFADSAARSPNSPLMKRQRLQQPSQAMRSSSALRTWCAVARIPAVRRKRHGRARALQRARLRLLLSGLAASAVPPRPGRRSRSGSGLAARLLGAGGCSRPH